MSHQECRRQFSVKHLFWSASCLPLLLGCGQSAPVDSENIEAVATVTSSHHAEEALYASRFARMGEAFATGKSLTTIYDTRANVIGATGADLSWLRAERDLKPETATRIDDYAAQMNSAAVIVMKSGAVIHERYFGDHEAQSLLNGKSLAKPLGVIAIGRAIQAGHIDSLDQKASDFLTEWRGTPKEEVSIRHLLAMRSGLHHQAADPSPDHIMNRAYLHPRHIEVILESYPQIAEPGERFDYSNANAELISPIIERATGKKYETWIAEEILQKIGAPGGEIWLNREGGIAHAGCCVMLPARSFAKLGQLVMQNGIWDGDALLPVGFVDQMLRTSPDHIHAGLGIYTGKPYIEVRGFHNPDKSTYGHYQSEPYKHQDLNLFDGSGNQVVYMSVAEELLILRMGSLPPKGEQWDNAYLPNLIFDAQNN